MLDPDYRDVLLLEVLPSSLRRVNPGLSYAALEQAMLNFKGVDAGFLSQRNEVFCDYLQLGAEVHFSDGSIRARLSTGSARRRTRGDVAP